MTTFIKAKFFLITSLSIMQAIPAFALTVEDAIQLLKTTKPIPSVITALGSTDPRQRAATEQLYDRQMAAVSVLSKAQIPSSAELLIPFLNYPEKNFDYAFPPALPLPAQSEVITQASQIKGWPVFSALVANPGAGPALVKYALDKRNPDMYRVAAFQVLKFIDTEEFKVVASNFKSEFQAAGPNAKQYIALIEAEHPGFNGVRWFSRDE